ncbi:contractile injection system tape measure protein [Flavobacterium sp. NRK F7]|uniref:contractile injection system tape measure protein n=1 Tax=Flavobacterium sp. NRK F7 TaxID=2954930 RepID=UPI002091C586|nr:contractile injection system tape measure protein [Flavobacterium sp. NRK F7]MCO6162335.1 contractile injection system tape measure protein [Flavobacterium sp. NRK F7]
MALVQIFPIKNAGIVILNNYIQMLFKRLQLTTEDQFVTPTAQEKAVFCLQYLATGLTDTEEIFLPLNKILCGLPLTTPLHNTAITLTDTEQQLIESLFQAVIGHWPAIGSTSIEGFRGNWLVRDGKLQENEERWEMTVEKRAYDLLLNQSPFSFSILKFPWMPKPLHVTWSY